VIKNVVYAAIAVAGISVGAAAVQVVDGAQITSLTAKVSVLSQTASRCAAEEQAAAAVANGLGTLSQPYTGPAPGQGGWNGR
jgi:hypothetical protein